MQILSSLIIFVASSGPTPTAPYLSCAGALGSHKNKIQGDNHLCHPAVYLSVYATQDIVGFPGCKNSLLAHLSFHPPESPSPSQQGSLSKFFCQYAYLYKYTVSVYLSV